MKDKELLNILRIYSVTKDIKHKNKLAIGLYTGEPIETKQSKYLKSTIDVKGSGFFHDFDDILVHEIAHWLCDLFGYSVKHTKKFKCIYEFLKKELLTRKCNYED